jgi:hypothetical protein
MATNVVVEAEATDIEKRLMDIKGSAGYWRVSIRPWDFKKLRIKSLDRCWEIIEKCRVFSNSSGSMIPFRWGYPPIGEKDSGEYWIQSGYDVEVCGKEIWRFHQSGQFIDYFTCFEDEFPGTGLKLDIFSTLYRITEIYEFAARLALKGIFDTGVKLTISLVGMKDRKPIERLERRITQRGGTIQHDDIIPNYIPSSNEIDIESSMDSINFIASSREEAINKTMEIYSKFGLNDYPKLILREKQDDFLERRL